MIFFGLFSDRGFRNVSLAFLKATMEAVFVDFCTGDVDELIGHGCNSIEKRLSWPKGTSAFLVFFSSINQLRLQSAIYGKISRVCVDFCYTRSSRQMYNMSYNFFQEIYFRSACQAYYNPGSVESFLENSTIT